MINKDVQTTAIYSAGMKLLRDTLGTIETEIFISTICSSEFDYTEWRKNLWDGLTPQELFARAAKTEEKHVTPQGVTVI